MAGKRVAKRRNKHNKKSKAPGYIILIILILLAIAGAVFSFLYFFTDIIKDDTELPQTTDPITTAAADSVPVTTEAQSAETVTTQAAAEASPSVTLPTDPSKGVANFFNASYIPNGKAENIETGEQVSIKNVFETTFAKGILTFNGNSTFTDTLKSEEQSSGVYAIQNGVLHAVYSNGEEMKITVTGWDGVTPSHFYVDYGSYRIYFGE